MDAVILYLTAKDKNEAKSLARVVLGYDDASRLLIIRLKYHDDTALACVCTSWLQRAEALSKQTKIPA